MPSARCHLHARVEGGRTAALVFAVLFWYVPDAVASVISLSSETIAPGSSIFLPVAFISEAHSVSGIQFDVQYDVSAMSVVAIIGPSARNSGKSVYLGEVGPNKRRFLIAGLNPNPIPDGVLMGIFANLNPSVSNGVYPLTLSNIIGTDRNGGTAVVRGLDGAVTIRGTIDQVVRLQPAGVLNGGSLLPGPVAPGEIITLIGSGIGPATGLVPVGSASSPNLGGTTVVFDGTSAPLLYAGPHQINAIAPYAVSGKPSTQVQINREGQRVAELTLPVLAAAPAIFTLDSSGVGQGAILNEDGTVNSVSNPASRGSVVVVFATGAGQTDPPGRDGQAAGEPFPKPVLPVSLRIGGAAADVLYAAAAPGLVAGVLQVNCRVPAGVVPGPSVPMVLRVGGVGSQEGVTVAIR